MDSLYISNKQAAATAVTAAAAAATRTAELLYVTQFEILFLWIQ